MRGYLVLQPGSIHLSFGHLHVLIAPWGGSRRWRRRCRLASLLGNHTLKVHLDYLPFEDTEVPLRTDRTLIRSCWADDTD